VKLAMLTAADRVVDVACGTGDLFPSHFTERCKQCSMSRASLGEI